LAHLGVTIRAPDHDSIALPAAAGNGIQIVIGDGMRAYIEFCAMEFFILIDREFLLVVLFLYTAKGKSIPPAFEITT